MRGLVAGILLTAVMVSCVKAPAPSEVDMRRREDRERKMTQIIALWTQIRGFRHDAGMDLDPPRLTIEYTPRTVGEAKRVCEVGHAVPPTCGDICSLADAVCDNAEAICTLADQLGKDDQMAQEKCTSAKVSCRESKQRCCKCSNNPPAPRDPTIMAPNPGAQMPAGGAPTP